MSPDDKRREGAEDALRILRVLPGLLHTKVDSDDEWFRRRDLAIAELMAMAGPLSPHAEGAMRVLVEAHVVAKQEGITLNFDGWEPETTMTAERLRETREEFKAEMDEMRAEEAMSQKVIPFPGPAKAASITC